MQAATSNILKFKQAHRQSVHFATTLYDVIAAVSEQVPMDEQYLIAPSVLKLLKDCGAGFLFKGAA